MKSCHSFHSVSCMSGKKQRKRVYHKTGQGSTSSKVTCVFICYERVEKGCRGVHLGTETIQAKLRVAFLTGGTNPAVVRAPEKKQLVESLYWIITYLKKKNQTSQNSNPKKPKTS